MLVTWEFCLILPLTCGTGPLIKNSSTNLRLSQQNEQNTPLILAVRSVQSKPGFFSFNKRNGAYPFGELIQAKNGDFYGTTQRGGSYGKGIVFRLTKAGKLTPLVHFRGRNGAYPYAGLIQAKNGNFYGTTLEGGSGPGCPSFNGCGTVFRLTPTGNLTTLVSFNFSNGASPMGVLLEAKNGNFYGTTSSGGDRSFGTVFRMTPSGSLTTLISFDLPKTGGNPIGGLIEARNGNFYGTTSRGGTGARDEGASIFRLTPTGQFRIVGQVKGKPIGRLIQAKNGVFYGTAVYGGVKKKGSVFRMTRSGQVTTLLEFNGNNGTHPYAGLIQDQKGHFYGTTQAGGSFGKGTVFRLSPGGQLTTLIHFDGRDGAYPYGELLQASDGNFYGLTQKGGSYQAGRAFELNP